MQETEAKIRLNSGEIEVLRQRLRLENGAPGSIDDETNVLFEAPDGHLRRSGQTLRLRSFGGRTDATLTFKGPVDAGSRFKSRSELEVGVNDAVTTGAILEALGYRPTGQYQKRREHWTLPGLDIAIDQLSSGDYVEIEGSEDSIISALQQLGLSGRPHIPNGYASLEAGAARPVS